MTDVIKNNDLYPRDLIGCPGCASTLKRFLDYVEQHEHTWVTAVSISPIIGSRHSH